jgi:hypothetical protein
MRMSGNSNDGSGTGVRCRSLLLGDEPLLDPGAEPRDVICRRRGDALQLGHPLRVEHRPPDVGVGTEQHDRQADGPGGVRGCTLAWRHEHDQVVLSVWPCLPTVPASGLARSADPAPAGVRIVNLIKQGISWGFLLLAEVAKWSTAADSRSVGGHPPREFESPPRRFHSSRANAPRQRISRARFVLPSEA